MKCGECANQAFKPVDAAAIRAHLLGKHVMGAYPLLDNDTCWFLAADFDEGTKYMRQFAEAWPEVDQIRQQPVGQLPWSTNLVLLTKLKKSEERLAYAASAVEHGWSRSVHHAPYRAGHRRAHARTNRLIDGKAYTNAGLGEAIRASLKR